MVRRRVRRENVHFQTPEGRALPPSVGGGMAERARAFLVQAAFEERMKGGAKDGSDDDYFPTAVDTTGGAAPVPSTRATLDSDSDSGSERGAPPPKRRKVDTSGERSAAAVLRDTQSALAKPPPAFASSSSSPPPAEGWGGRPATNGHGIDGISDGVEDDSWDSSSDESEESEDLTESLPACGRDALRKLLDAVDQHYSSMRLDDKAQAQRKQFFDELARISAQSFPDGRLMLFGSSATGLCTRSSDLDVSLLVEPDSDAKNVLQRLRGAVARIARVQFIRHARVPILKCSGKGAPYEFDISCNRPEGGWNAEIIKHFLAQDARTAPALMYLHTAFDKAGIKNSRFQFLSAFSINVAFFHYCLAVASPPVLRHAKWTLPADDDDHRYSTATINPPPMQDATNATGSQSVSEVIAGFLAWFSQVCKRSIVTRRQILIDIRHPDERSEKPVIAQDEPGVAMVNPVDGTHNITSNIKHRQWSKIQGVLQDMVAHIADGRNNVAPRALGNAVGGIRAVFQETSSEKVAQATAWTVPQHKARKNRKQYWRRGQKAW